MAQPAPPRKLKAAAPSEAVDSVDETSATSPSTVDTHASNETAKADQKRRKKARKERKKAEFDRQVQEGVQAALALLGHTAQTVSTAGPARSFGNESPNSFRRRQLGQGSGRAATPQKRKASSEQGG